MKQIREKEIDLRVETLLSRLARWIVVRANIHFESSKMIGRELDFHLYFLQIVLWHFKPALLEIFLEMYIFLYASARRK